MLQQTIHYLEVVKLPTTRAIHTDCKSELDVASSIPQWKTILVTWSKTKQSQHTTTHTNDRYQVSAS